MKMKHKKRSVSIGIVTPVASNTSSLFLSSLVRLFHSVFGDIYVIAGNANPKDYGKAHVYSVMYKTGVNAFTRITNYIYLQLKISYRLAKLTNNVDLWIFFLGGEVLLLPMVTAKLLGKKVVLVLGGSLQKEGQIKKDILYNPLRFLKRINLPLSDRIVVYSENLIKEWGLEKYQNKISVAARHFTNFDRFRIEKTVGKRDNLIGYIGILSEIKGTPNFLEAIPKVLKIRSDVKFLIAGDGELREKLERYLNNENLNSEVKFVGWIPHDELPIYLNELKLLVLPSYTEGLPNIMLEAMTCGTPVLATPVGAIPDILTDGETGFTMEDNSPACIAENVMRALEHPDLERIVGDARALVEREFTYEAAVERYRKILEEF